MTTWPAVDETETNWGGVSCRWLLGEQEDDAPEHAGERLLFGDHDRLGGWCDEAVRTTFSAVSRPTTSWSQLWYNKFGGNSPILTGGYFYLK